MRPDRDPNPITAGKNLSQSTRPLIFPLALLTGVYLFATLPWLDRAPRVIWDEGEIAAPAHKLATTGVFGSDLYAGYYGHERRNYYLPPLFPLVQALSFKLFGFGVIQARAVSVVCGLGVLWLCFIWGQALSGTGTGLLAGFFLCLLSICLLSHSSGMPFLDAARTGRYDLMAVFWLLAALVVFIKAEEKASKSAYLIAGFFGGLACLSHVYGVLAPVLTVVFLVCRIGWPVWRKLSLWLLILGWFLAMAPWLAYVLQDLASYTGQSLKWRVMGRFDIFDPAFYWQNLVAEKTRYISFLADGDGFRLFPRLGLWFLIGGIAAANILFLKRKETRAQPALFLVFAALPLGAVFLAFVAKFKVPSYTALLMPFTCLQLALVTDRVREALKRRAKWLRLGATALLLAVLAEGGWNLSGFLARAGRMTSYDALGVQIAARLPPKARVLASCDFGLALASYRPRSLYLPFFLAHPSYHPKGTMSMERALAEVDPDFVLEDPIFRMPHFGPPEAESLEPDFRRFLTRRCSRIVFSTETATYGRLVLYACEKAEAAGGGVEPGK